MKRIRSRSYCGLEIRPGIEVEEILGHARRIPEVTVFEQRPHAVGRHHGVPGPDPGDAEVFGHALDDHQVRQPADLVGHAPVEITVSLAGEVDEALVDDDVGDRPQLFEHSAASPREECSRRRGYWD